MTPSFNLLAFCRPAVGVAAACLLAVPALAAGDHDHGHDHGAQAPAATTAQPRFTAVSESFELVGVLKDKQLTLYLDRSADNSPVRGAQIELDIAGTQFKAQRRGDEDYEVVLPEAPQPGVLAITATVTAGAETDLLAGELDLHEAGPVAHTEGHGWAASAPWATALVVALLLAGAFIALGQRRARAHRTARAGGAA